MWRQKKGISTDVPDCLWSEEAVCAMGSIKTKMLLLIIVYFAGFATAIYCLAPVPEKQTIAAANNGFPDTALKSDQFADSFSRIMHKALQHARTAAGKAAEMLKKGCQTKIADSGSQK